MPGSAFGGALAILFVISSAFKLTLDFGKVSNKSYLYTYEKYDLSKNESRNNVYDKLNYTNNWNFGLKLFNTESLNVSFDIFDNDYV